MVFSSYLPTPVWNGNAYTMIIYWKYITSPLVIEVHRVPWVSEKTLDFGTELGLLKTRKKPVMNQGWRSLVLVRFPAASEASNSGSGTRSHSSLGPQVLWKSYLLQQLQSRCRPRVDAGLELGPLEPGEFQNSQQKLKTQTGGTSWHRTTHDPNRRFQIKPLTLNTNPTKEMTSQLYYDLVLS